MSVTFDSNVDDKFINGKKYKVDIPKAELELELISQCGNNGGSYGMYAWFKINKHVKIQQK